MSDDLKAVFNRMSREDRRVARTIRNNAAESMELGRIRFMRLVVEGDQDALDELKLSLIESGAAGWEYDEERFKRFLDMIIAFIRAIMAIFGAL